MRLAIRFLRLQEASCIQISPYHSSTTINPAAPNSAPLNTKMTHHHGAKNKSDKLASNDTIHAASPKPKTQAVNLYLEEELQSGAS